MKIHFISINTLTNIPSVRFIVDFFIKKYKTLIIITERAIKNENDYYADNKKIIFDNIDESENIQEYSNQTTLSKIKKYINLFLLVKKSLGSKNNSIIITPDFQVLYFIFLITFFIKNSKTKIIYFQFELFEYPGRFNNYIYKKVLKNADKIDLAIFPEKNRLDFFLKSCTKKPKQNFVLPNTCEPISLKKPVLRHEILRKIPEDTIIIGHVGNVGGTDHYFSEVIQVAEVLSEKNIFFIFIGNQSDTVKKKKEQIKSTKILFFDKIPHQELKSIYPFFDLGLILYKGLTPNFEFAAPNKLYEYWAYGIPVLAHHLKGLTGVFDNNLQGTLLDMTDINNVSNYILSYKKKNRKELIKFFNKKLAISYFLKEMDYIVDNI